MSERALFPELDRGDEETFELEWIGSPAVRNVTCPTLTTVEPVGEPSGTHVVVCPGGAFHFLSMESEGFAVARWLAERGHAASVLKYRTLPTPADLAGFEQALAQVFLEPDAVRTTLDAFARRIVDDGLRSVELARDGAERVVLLGFSAGARLAAEVLRAGGDLVDAAGLVYLPSIGDEVPAGPPLFLLAAADDPLGIDGSLDLHRTWRAAGRPVELHLYERGGHGFGLHATGLPVDGWIDRFAEWLAMERPT